jgi:hypothetical protein
MKKLFLSVVFAVAGIAISNAYGYWASFQCPDGFVYSHFVVVQEDLSKEQESDLVDDYEKDMMRKLCGGDEVK